MSARRAVKRIGGGLAPDAREILHALLEGGDLLLMSSRRARVSLTISRELFEALCAWEADEEDDEIDEGR